MSPAVRACVLRKVERARRLIDAAHDHQEAADELFAEAGRLVDEIKDQEEGRPLPLRLVRDATRH